MIGRGVLLMLMLMILGPVAPVWSQTAPLMPGSRPASGGVSTPPKGATTLDGNAVDESFFFTRSLLENAFKNLQGLAWGILTLLIGIEVVAVALKILSSDGSPIMLVLSRLLMVFLLAFLVGNYMSAMKFVQWAAINLGRIATGNVTQMAEGSVAPGPSLLYKTSQQWLSPIYDAAIKQKRGESVKTEGNEVILLPRESDGTAIVLTMATFVMMIPFTILIVYYFVIYVKYSLLIGFGVVLLPFGMAERTRFIAEGFLSSVLAHGVEILLFNFALGVGYAILRAVAMPTGGSLSGWALVSYAMTACVLAFFYMMMCMEIPRLAGKLVRGRIPLEVKS